MEVVGATSALIGIVVFALKASKEAYDLVESIKEAPRRVRELRGELVALTPILESIRGLVASDSTSNKFEDLRLPLHQCGMVCFNLGLLVRQCTEHSGADGSRRSVRDRIKMEYKGKTIDGYKAQLASYKATIEIALSLYTLTSTALTAESIDDLKETIRESIQNAQLDIKEQIEDINERLQDLSVESSALTISSQSSEQRTGPVTLQARQQALEEDRLALEAEQQALAQSQSVCTTAEQRLEAVARPQPGPSSVQVVFSGANNTGIQIGLNNGTSTVNHWR